jgi:uncharacterized protein (TIGR03084 family)
MWRVSGVADVFTDLAVEGDELDRLLDGLSPQEWGLPTPAKGWTIAHQIAHLAATFRLAGLAAADPEAFSALTATLSPDFDANVAHALSAYVNDPCEVLRARWRAERDTAVKALTALSPNAIVPWLVRPLPAAVLAAAGMMELFAHGQDVADTLGIHREATDRLEHLVAFAARVYDFGYLARGLKAPEAPFSFQITGPTGDTWHHGPDDAPNVISGPAQDFCLLVTRRRHPDDLTLSATGPHASHWLSIAQAYRGPAGPGRKPGEFSKPV